MDPGIPRPDDFEPGDPLSADALNEWAAHVSGSPTYPGGGLHSASGASGSMMRLALPRRPIMALLSGSSSPYSWTQKLCTAAGTLATGPLSGTNAYETNGTASLGGNTVRLFPDGRGGWWFTSKCCTASCTGNLTVNVSCGGLGRNGATVTITQGATTHTATTSGFGSATLTPGASGTWSISVSLAGFTTYTGTFTFSCSNQTVNVPLAGASTTVTGKTRACGLYTGGPYDLANCTIVFTQGATTIGSGTSDASANYSITLAWSSGTVTQTVTHSSGRYAPNVTTFTPSSCNGTTSRTTVSDPATDYYCQPCVPNALYKTLFLTIGGYSATLTYDSGSTSWKGTLSLSLACVTAIPCTIGTATATVLIEYKDCKLGVGYNTDSRFIPGDPCYNKIISDAMCSSSPTTCAAPGSPVSVGITATSVTATPFNATWTGSLFMSDANGTAVLTGATLTE